MGSGVKLAAEGVVVAGLELLPGIAGAIFDCDGTLADSMPIHQAAWHAALARYGVTVDEDFLEGLNGAPTREILLVINERFRCAVPVDEFCPLKERLAFENLHLVKPIEPVVELAHSLKGKVPIAVASGGVTANVELVLKAIGLDNFFDAMVTASDPVRPKPEPDIFLEAARRLGVEPQACQVFEDGPMGFQAARAAGMQVIDVRRFLG